MGFYRSDDPTDSFKALKEVVVLRIGFSPTRSTCSGREPPVISGTGAFLQAGCPRRY